VIDETLQVFGTAVVPLCLTLIGMSLAYLGWPRQWRGALGLVLIKLLVLPAVVLPIAHWGFGIDGLPLQVIVMVAALPGGSNVLSHGHHRAGHAAVHADRAAVADAAARCGLLTTHSSTVGPCRLSWTPGGLLRPRAVLMRNARKLLRKQCLAGDRPLLTIAA